MTNSIKQKKMGSKVATKIALSIIALTYVTASLAQTTVQDKQNLGQLKRMVYEQWDDWQPTPKTGFLGIPKNFEGWFYWDVLNHSYYKGQDSRPYRTNGPFTVTEGMGALQTEQDHMINDSMHADFLTASKEYLSRLGGTGDVAWTSYFGDQFDDNLKKITSVIPQFAIAHPKAYQALIKDDRYAIYNTFIHGESDNVQAIHNSYLDMGERMKTYFEELRRIEVRNESIGKLMDRYVILTEQLPDDSKDNSDELLVGYNNDEELVNTILSTYKF